MILTPQSYMQLRQQGITDEQIADNLAKDAGLDLPSLFAQGVTAGQVARNLSGIKETEYQNIQNPQPNYTAFGTTFSGVARGTVNAARMLGYAAETADPDGGLNVGDALGGVIKKVADYADTNLDILKPDVDEVTGKDSFLKRGYKGFLQAAPLTVATMIPAVLAAPFTAGTSLAVPAGMLISGATTGIVFGLGTYGQSVERIKQEQPDISDAEAHNYGVKQAFIEAGPEAVSSALTFGIFKFGLVSELGPGAAIKQMLKAGPKKLFTDWGLNTLQETATEMYSGYAGAKTDIEYGMGDTTPATGAIESIVPSVLLSTIFWLGGTTLNAAHKSALLKQLNSEKVEERQQAAGTISGLLKAENETEIAAAWDKMTGNRIAQGAPIDINQDILAFNPDLKNIKAEEETVDTQDSTITTDTQDPTLTPDTQDPTLTPDLNTSPTKPTEVGPVLPTDIIPGHKKGPYSSAYVAGESLKTRKGVSPETHTVVEVQGGWVIREIGTETIKATVPTAAPPTAELTPERISELTGVTVEEYNNFNVSQQQELKREALSKIPTVETKNQPAEVVEPVEPVEPIKAVIPDTLTWNAMSLEDRLNFAEENGGDFDNFVKSKKVKINKDNIEQLQTDFTNRVYNAKLKSEAAERKATTLPYSKDNTSTKELTPSIFAEEGKEEKPITNVQRLAYEQLREAVLPDNTFTPWAVNRSTKGDKGQTIDAQLPWINQPAIEALNKENKPSEAVTAATLKALEKKGFIKEVTYTDGKQRWVPADWKAPVDTTQTILRKKAGETTPVTEEKSTQLPKPDNSKVVVKSKLSAALDRAIASLQQAKDIGATKEVIAAKTKIVKNLRLNVIKQAAQTPTVETPTVETPTVETPTVETPTVETPTVETPTVDDILPLSGKPYANKNTATMGIKRASAEGTHEAVQVEGGWVGRKIVEASTANIDVKTAYENVKKRNNDGMSIVNVSDLLKESGMSKEELHAELKKRSKEGSVTLHKGVAVSKSFGDWSLSNDEVKAAAIEDGGQKYTTVSFKDKPKDKPKPKGKVETIEEFLARGGKISKPDAKPVTTETIDKLQEQLGDAYDPDVFTVLDKQADLPNEVKEHFKLEEYDLLDQEDPQYSKKKNKVSGVYHKGKIYLVQENLEAGNGVWAVTLHEGVHHLLRTDKAFKMIYKGLLSQVNEKLKTDTKLQDIHNWVIQEYPDATKNQQAEETLAHYLQDSANVKEKWYQEIIAKIKLWLNKHFPKLTLSGHEMGLIVAGELRRSLLANKTAMTGTPVASKVMTLASKVPGWSSRVEDNFITERGPEKATPENWVKTFKSWLSKTMPLPLKEEFYFSNVLEWMEEQKGTVTKQQVLDYMAENGLKARLKEIRHAAPMVKDFEEILRDRGLTPETWIDEVILNSQAATASELNAFKTVQKLLNNNTYEDNSLPGADNEMYDAEIENNKALKKVLEKYMEPGEADRFMAYAVGIEDVMNLEEHSILLADKDLPRLMKLREQLSLDRDAMRIVMEKLNYLSNYTQPESPRWEHVTLPTESDLDNYQELVFTIPITDDYEGYSHLSPHFYNENEVVYIRVSSIEDTLFMHENQSDLHQEALKIGYGYENKMPNLPFKTFHTTLGLKKAVIEAIERGHTSITWAKTPHHVAAIEGWANFKQKKGKWYAGPENVDGIIKKYTEYIPQIISKIFKPYGGGTLGTKVLEDYTMLDEHYPHNTNEFNEFTFSEELINNISERGLPLASKVSKEDQKVIDEQILGGNNESLSNEEQLQHNFIDTVEQSTTSSIPGVSTVAKVLSDLNDAMKKGPIGPVRTKDRQSLNWFTKVFSSPEYYLRNAHPTTEKIVNHSLKEDTMKYDLEHKILGDWTDTITSLESELPKIVYEKAYKVANDYLVNTDLSGKAFSISPKNIKQILNNKNVNHEYIVTEWEVKNPEGKVVASFKDESKAEARMVELEQQMLKKWGFSEHTLTMIKEARLLTNRSFSILVAELRRQTAQAKEFGLTEPTATYRNAKGKIERLALSQLVARVGDLRGSFFPRERQKKDFVLIAENDQGNKILETYSGLLAENEISAPWFNKVKRLINSNLPIGKRSRELESRGYDVTIKQVPTPSEVIFDAPGLLSSMDALLQSAEKGMSNKEMTDAQEKAMQSIHNQLAQSIADIYKIKGHSTSRKARSKDPWIGYETDMNKALTSSAQRMAAGEARRTTTRNMLLTFTGRDVSFTEWQTEHPTGSYKDYLTEVKTKAIDPSSQKELYDATRTYMNFVLRPDTGFDRAVGYMKALAVVKFLGFRVSSAAVNMTNMALGAPATISGYTNLSIAKSWAALGKAGSVYTGYRMRGLKKAGKVPNDVHFGASYTTEPTAEQVKVLNYISEQGMDEAKFNHDAARAIQDSGSRWFNSIMKYSMYMFGATEKANRAITILAAYDAIRQSNHERYARVNKTLNESTDKALLDKAFEQVMKLSEDISSQAHGTYGKAAKPWLVQKIRLLDLPYTFMKFQHNYILNMVDLGFNKHQIKQALYMLLAPSVLAGAGATVVTPILSAIAKGLNIDDDPEEAFYNYIASMVGSDDLARHGLLGALTGVDFKGSLQMNNPMPTSLPEIFGAPGAVFTDIYDAWEHFTYGETTKGMEDLLPKAAGNVLKGAREYQEGLTTGSYSPIYYGEQQVEGTLAEAWMRALSFSPSRLSGIREKQWKETKVRQAYTEERTAIARKFKNYYVTKEEDRDPAKLVKLADEVRAYNEAVQRSKQKLMIPYITSNWLEDTLKKAFKPNKYERQRSEL